MHNLTILLIIIQLQFALSDNHLHPTSDTEDKPKNYLRIRCSYDRVCDNNLGYICRQGTCTCKWGRPDPYDGWRCKVQVKLGDYCRDKGGSDPGNTWRRDVFVGRKCPHYSECSETKGICICREDFFERKGSTCVPKVLNTTKICKDHLDCVISRGQQCFAGHCVECALGRFRHYKSSSISLSRIDSNIDHHHHRPDCICLEQVKSKILSESDKTTTLLLRPFTPRLKKDSCIQSSYYGTHCTINENCHSPSMTTTQLQCSENKICECRKGTRSSFEIGVNNVMIPIHGAYCVTPVNEPCNEDGDCHPTKAYCELRAETPICMCKNGFQRNGDDCISRFYLEPCGQFFSEGTRLHDLLGEQKLACYNGNYECMRPKDMFWDAEKGYCVSLVGGRCDLVTLVDSCAGNSRCWEYNNVKENRCQCPEGWKATKDRKNCMKIKGF